MKSKRTKALEIPKEVKLKVHERDGGWCIFCGKPVSWHLSNAHYISRAYGGLGIVENVVTACAICHKITDHSTSRQKMLKIAKQHLKNHHPEFTDEMRIYKK